MGRGFALIFSFRGRSVAGFWLPAAQAEAEALRTTITTSLLKHTPLKLKRQLGISSVVILISVSQCSLNENLI
ncbi:MAG: hypothetical protein ACI8R9_001316 [Paraglaciecola sp.]|jgi:hypothetical protein